MTDREPLWRAMEDASTAIIPPSSNCYAAEIGVIAREIEIQFATYVEDDIALHIVGWLLYEVERAEAGE